MNTAYNDRTVRIYFTKTVSANPPSSLQNEINDLDIRLISSNTNWWNEFIPRYLENRNLELSTEWFNNIQLQSQNRFFDIKKYFAYKPYFNHIIQYFRCKFRNQREKTCRFMGSNLI